MVFEPPGSAKSTYASKLFPAWYMAQGRRSVIGASHTTTLAEEFSTDVRRYITQNISVLGYRLDTDRAGRWRADNGSEYLAAGVGAGIAGFRADLAIIDDPVRSRQDADSETYRERVWKWFLADLSPRLKPDARIVLIQTRWHEDDLAGRLLAAHPGRWRVLSLPALAEEGDALGRAPGEPLWSDDEYGYGADLAAKRDELERAGASREWASLYQQRPRPAEGALFKVAMLGALDGAPPGTAVRAWDLAATARVGTRDPDWTVGIKLLKTMEGRFVIDDVVRLRGGPDQVEAAIVATAQRDGRGVRIGLPQDPGQAGKAQVLYLTRKLAGFSVESSPETGDKAERAMPVAAQCNVGNLAVVRGGWNRAFIDELAAFPSGAHDDQVDALSRGFGMLMLMSSIETWARLGATS